MSAILTPEERIQVTAHALTEFVRETGAQFRTSAGAVAMYAEMQRARLAAAVLAGEPGIEDAARAALGAVKLFAAVQVQGDAAAVDRRLVAVLGVALNIAGAAL